MRAVSHNTPWRRRLGSLLVAGLLGLAGAGMPVLAQHLPAAPQDHRAQQDQQDQLARVLRGLAHSMAISAAALDAPGQRLRATRALDDARRVARVLRDLTPTNTAIDHAGLGAVERARHALQNGDPKAAGGILRVASAQLVQQASHAPSPSRGPLTDDDQGKLVINAEGRRIGRLQRLVSPGRASEAVLRVGGTINLFGFVDAGYRQVTVPANRLLAGRRMVVLTSAIGPEQLARLPAYSD